MRISNSKSYNLFPISSKVNQIKIFLESFPGPPKKFKIRAQVLRSIAIILNPNILKIYIYKISLRYPAYY